MLHVSMTVLQTVLHLKQCDFIHTKVTMETAMKLLKFGRREKLNK